MSPNQKKKANKKAVRNSSTSSSPPGWRAFLSDHRVAATFLALFLGIVIADLRIRSEFNRLKGQFKDIKRERDDAREEKTGLTRKLEEMTKDRDAALALQPIFKLLGPRVDGYRRFRMNRHGQSSVSFGSCPEVPCYSLEFSGIEGTGKAAQVVILFDIRDARIHALNNNLRIPAMPGCRVRIVGGALAADIIIDNLPSLDEISLVVATGPTQSGNDLSSGTVWCPSRPFDG